MSFCNPLALVSVAGWYVGKAADFTGSSYTATPEGLKCSSTMNRAVAECSSVNGVTEHGSPSVEQCQTIQERDYN